MGQFGDGALASAALTSFLGSCVVHGDGDGDLVDRLGALAAPRGISVHQFSVVDPAPGALWAVRRAPCLMDVKAHNPETRARRVALLFLVHPLWR